MSSNAGDRTAPRRATAADAADCMSSGDDDDEIVSKVPSI
jgi:hypothetical protein